MNYTKGPWLVEDGVDLLGGDGFSCCIAHIETNGEPTTNPTIRANAALLEAAPELVEALEVGMAALREMRDTKYEQWIEAITPNMMDAWTKMDRALTKAKGGSHDAQSTE